MPSKNTDALSAVFAATAGMLFPGLGHYIQGEVRRGFFATTSVLSMLISGAWLGGKFYSFFEFHEGFLTAVFSFCNMGLGISYFLFEWFGVLTTDRSSLPTSEYGNVFLMLAGLVNYLLVLDAFDTKIGRKL